MWLSGGKAFLTEGAAGLKVRSSMPDMLEEQGRGQCGPKWAKIIASEVREERLEERDWCQA